jgi:hypothetical protein
MIIVFEFIAFMLLFLPLIWEITDDKNGDFDKAKDVVIRIAIAFFVGSIIWLSSIFNLVHHHGLLASAFLSLAIHFLIFDYAIAFVLGHKDWFSYMGHGVIDRIKFWNTMNPKIKLVIRIVVFGFALVLYFQ